MQLNGGEFEEFPASPVDGRVDFSHQKFVLFFVSDIIYV